MRVIFMADAHLRHPEDHNYQKTLRFLHELPGKTDQLIILGDFFEFWLGDSPAPFPHYQPLLNTLDEITRKGVELTFFEGNHDFHLQRYFSTTFHAMVFPDSATITLDGKKLFLCHGDRINRKDYSYRLLRLLFRNPLTRLIARIIPASIPAWVAVNLGNHSKSNHQSTEARWDYNRLIRDFASERFAEGYDVVVTAHFHRPIIEQCNQKTLLALGDWITQFSYGEWVDGTVTLKKFD